MGVGRASVGAPRCQSRGRGLWRSVTSPLPRQEISTDLQAGTLPALAALLSSPWNAPEAWRLPPFLDSSGPSVRSRLLALQGRACAGLMVRGGTGRGLPSSRDRLLQGSALNHSRVRSHVAPPSSSYLHCSHSCLWNAPGRHSPPSTLKQCTLCATCLKPECLISWL